MLTEPPASLLPASLSLSLQYTLQMLDQDLLQERLEALEGGAAQ